MPNVSNTGRAADASAAPAARGAGVAVGMNQPDAMNRIIAAEEAAGRGIGPMLLPGGMIDEITDYMAENVQDAANSWAASENASLHVLRYSYGTHKGMEAWVAEGPPPGEKLKMQVICTPSWHVGDANLKNYALTNSYTFRITYPDGKSETKSFKVNGNTPEYATKSPVLEIDADKYTGKDVIIEGWPSATSVGGYTEARRTTLHL